MYQEREPTNDSGLRPTSFVSFLPLSATGNIPKCRGMSRHQESLGSAPPIGGAMFCKGNLRFPLNPSLQVKIGMFPVAEGGRKCTQIHVYEAIHIFAQKGGFRRGSRSET